MLDVGDLLQILSDGYYAWLYRGWLFLVSSTYRESVREEWKKETTAGKLFDVFFSIAFMVIEVILVVFALRHWKG